MNTWTFSPSSTVVVTGTNPENADITNPTGASYGLAWFVQAWTDYGDTREFSVPSEARAEALCASLNARMAAGKLPVLFNTWVEGRPIYGSPAYVAYGAEDDLAWERRMEEDGHGWGY
jgi:hypothetical protein